MRIVYADGASRSVRFPCHVRSACKSKSGSVHRHAAATFRPSIYRVAAADGYRLSLASRWILSQVAGAPPPHVWIRFFAPPVECTHARNRAPISRAELLLWERINRRLEVDWCVDRCASHVIGLFSIILGAERFYQCCSCCMITVN